MTAELAEEIRRLFAGNPAYEIYTVPRRNYIGKRWIQRGGWYPSAQVKLFKPAVFRWEETTVHPRGISDRPWGNLSGDLIHHSYRDISDFIGKLNRQTTFEAQKWVMDKRKMPLGKALWRTIDRFYRAYWMKKGKEDGFIGYAVAVFGGMYQFLSFAKYWHMKHEAAGPVTRGAALSPCSDSPRSFPRQNQVERSAELRAAGKCSPSVPPAAMVTGPATISAVILSKNAAKTIPDCLASLKWADEVIVVDGGSTDGTIELCENAGARVILDETKDDFARLRNVGTQAAAGDWVLQLDADEVVTPEFRSFFETLAPTPEPYAAYKFRRRNNFLGHWMRFGGWDHQSLHLFFKGKARYEGRVHEKLIVDGHVGTLRAGVQHFPFRSIEEFLERQNRYTTLEARQMLETNPAISETEIRTQTTRKPLKLFWKMYVKKQGFRDGMPGFLFSGLFAFVHFLKWVKVWEILDDQKTN